MPWRTTLRKDPLTRQIPIIFLSATYVTPDDKKFALSLGAVRFMEKPIDTEEFLLTIAEILTQGTPTLPTPMNERDFYQGYRERLEHKLRHKNTQIARTERLLAHPARGAETGLRHAAPAGRRRPGRDPARAGPDV